MRFKDQIAPSKPFRNNPSLRLAVAPECGHIMCGECYEHIKRTDNNCPSCRVSLTKVRYVGENFYLREKVAEMDSIHEQQVVKVKKVTKNNENLRENPWKNFGNAKDDLCVKKLYDHKYHREDLNLTALDLHFYRGELTCNVAVAYEKMKVPESKPFGVHVYKKDVFIQTDHTMMITGIKQNESNRYLILTSSMDGTVALLDNRVAKNVMLTEKIPSEQFVCPLWDWNNEHVFLTGSTTGTVVTFDKRFCKSEITSIDNLHLKNGEKSSIVGLYNYQDFKETREFAGFNSSPKIVAVTQTGIDLLFEDNEKMYTRHNVFAEKMNYVSNSAFDNATKTILAVTQFPKMSNSLQNGQNGTYRYQFMQLPAWNYTFAKSVPLHQWYVRNLFNYSREKSEPPIGEKVYAVREYTGLNKVTMFHHPASQENPTVLIACCQPGLPMTIDCYQNGSILPICPNQICLYENFRKNLSITSCAENGSSSCLMLLRKNEWRLFCVSEKIPNLSDGTNSSSST
jgi:hypothetical protein